MLSPPVRTIVVVSENQLNDLRLQLVNEEIQNVKVQQEELEAAYNRRKQNLSDTLASLDGQIKQLQPAKEANVTTKRSSKS